MKLRKFGETGTEVPIIGQGTWQIPENGQARDEAVKALQKGAESGMIHIDTAEMYGNAEEVISEIFSKIPREKLFIVSKVLPSNASYTSTMEACERSLQRLKIDYLDCYLLHWRGHHPLTDTMAAFEKLEQKGLIKSFGVSNFDVDDLEEAIECLSLGKIACNQVLYNLGVRAVERSLIPFCQKNNISFVGYTPFGSIPKEGTSEHDGLSKIATKHNATVRQVALSFLTRLDNTFTIPKASKSTHVAENASAGDLELDQEDLELIDLLYPVPNRDVPLQML